MSKGKKFDSGKERWGLVPWSAMKEVVKVLMHGAEKYGAWNWLKVEDARRRYWEAAMRHLIAWGMPGAAEKSDPETGISHLAHGICSLLFLLSLELE